MAAFKVSALRLLQLPRVSGLHSVFLYSVYENGFEGAGVAL